MTIEKRQSDEACDILVPNQLKNAEHLGLTVWLASPTMKSSYAYWYIAFWTVAAVYSADNVSQVMKLKAINRYIM